GHDHRDRHDGEASIESQKSKRNVDQEECFRASAKLIDNKTAHEHLTGGNGITIGERSLTPAGHDNGHNYGQTAEDYRGPKSSTLLLRVEGPSLRCNEPCGGNRYSVLNGHQPRKKFIDALGDAPFYVCYVREN